jgi:ABC-type dipeptide/oligopeptide/nickel transport system permease component
MRRYLIRRVAQLVPALLGIVLVTFLIIRLGPGDPAAMLVDTTLLSGDELARSGVTP